jgi:hypothetical protein
VALEGKAHERLDGDLLAMAKGYKVDDFIQKIVDQCREVYARHEAKKDKEFLDDGTSRVVELEMVEVKVWRA